jgi:hypothetical protein
MWTQCTIFSIKNNSVIPSKIQQFYKDTPQHHHFSILVQILNKLQLQPIILHLHPSLLHRSPPNIVYFLICHRIFPKYRFRPLNFNHSYLFNRNFESGDSCIKILRITSSFSLSYPYSYDCCICVIVWLSVRRICFEAFQVQVYEDFQDQVYEDSDLFFSKQWGKLPWIYCAYIYFSIYSVESKLHDRKVCFAHLC